MQRANVLRQADIFYRLSDEHLEKLSAVCEELTFHEPGETIVRENSPSDELYVIASGAVEVVVDPALAGQDADAGHGPTTIATLQTGQTFGEIGLVDRGLRSASVRTAGAATRLLAIRREDLLRLCEADLALGYRLMRNIATELAFKIRNTDWMVREQLLWKPTGPKT